MQADLNVTVKDSLQFDHLWNVQGLYIQAIKGQSTVDVSFMQSKQVMQDKGEV